MFAIRLLMAVCFLLPLPAACRAGMPLLPRLYSPLQLAESLDEFRDREFFEYIHKFAAIERTPPFLFTVGLLYEHGIGVERDGAQALRWYRLAAAAGYHFRPYLGREADAAVARLTRDGEPVGGPLAEKAAILDGQVETSADMQRLSLRYFYGINAPIDYARSEEWQTKAVIRERLDSAARLAESLKSGAAGDPTGKERYRAQLGEALQSLTGVGDDASSGRAAEANGEGLTGENGVPQSPQTQTLMEYAGEIFEDGRRHYRGEGVPVDYFTAALRFAEAADFGIEEPLCYFFLAEIQDKGLLGQANTYSAGKNYRLAADFGHPEAMVRLAALHEHGRGVRQSVGEAKRWYAAAGNQGLDVSGDMRRLDGLAAGDADREREEAFRLMERDAQFRAAFNHSPFRHRDEMDRSRRWLIRASESGHPDAMRYLGGMLIDGDSVWGIEADPAQGGVWLEKAQRAGAVRKHAIQQEG